MPDTLTVTSWDELPVMVPFSLAARVIGVSRSTLYNLVAAGDLHPRRIGGGSRRAGRVFVTKTELRRYVEGEESR